ncbi:small ribosomal subunit protein uS9m [Trichomonascus vanleenenianus]|uniref:mitochondrial 37S ribosomal protein uS9m MRPS9 n=1 Tax=Trichomonascus vanleenenianus TaxID=2268995 RepID=UPI003ECACBCF
MAALRLNLIRPSLRLAVSGIRYQSNIASQTPFQKRSDEFVRDYERYNGLDVTRSSADAQLVNFNAPEHRSPELDRLRVVPRDRAFFMANPPHEEIMRGLNDLLQRHINLPTIAKDQVDNRTTWLSQEDYRAMLGGIHFKPKYYKELVRHLTRLSVIDPQLMPNEVRNNLAPFTKRKSDNYVAKKYPSLDELGRAIAVGRRKTASARVQMVKSSETIKGQVLINNRPLFDYFPRLADRNTVMYPLKVVGGESSYNMFITVSGGGLAGQASAVAHGIARALVIHNPLFLTRLSRAGVLQRDARKKERKKPGKPKARKSYTWVKR